MEKKGSFEETIKELEKIATELENGDISLEDSVSKFEEGMKLSKSASDYLEKAEKKITVLINDRSFVCRLFLINKYFLFLLSINSFL